MASERGELIVFLIVFICGVIFASALSPHRRDVSPGSGQSIVESAEKMSRSLENIEKILANQKERVQK